MTNHIRKYIGICIVFLVTYKHTQIGQKENASPKLIFRVD
jgi:hypothetical protein